MSQTAQDVLPEIAVRIPGQWNGPEDLAAALPKGYRLHTGRLHLPDGGRVGVFPHPPDEEFPRLFVDGCRQKLSARQRSRIHGYKVNLCLAAPGGSSTAVGRMFKATGAVLLAGGLGVFVDNSGCILAADAWLTASECPKVDQAFLSLITVFPGESELWSLGMHMIGLRDAAITRTGPRDADHETLNDFLEYSLVSGMTISDRDLVGDESGPRFELRKEPSRRFPPGSPLHNPYGQWRLEPLGFSAD